MPVNLHSRSSDDEGDEARIEIIPLIDIMFFLLAAFMLVSLSMTQMKRVPLNLPTATTGVADTKTPPWQIAADANGVITVTSSGDAGLPADAQGKSITLTPIDAANAALTYAANTTVAGFKCAPGTMPGKYLPGSCK